MKINEIKDRWRNFDVLSVRKLTPYQRRKEHLRMIAIDWQYEFANETYSWGELCDITSWFEQKAMQYGLLQEFRENGIC